MKNFVAFSEYMAKETMAWKNHFDFFWPLVWLRLESLFSYLHCNKCRLRIFFRSRTFKSFHQTWVESKEKKSIYITYSGPCIYSSRLYQYKMRILLIYCGRFVKGIALLSLSWCIGTQWSQILYKITKLFNLIHF